MYYTTETYVKPLISNNAHNKILVSLILTASADKY